jgi:anaerobic dimethyl sulfoxide reductase subunit A
MPVSTTHTVHLTSCPHDCGGRCVLKAHVHNAVIRRIETDDGPEPQLRACVRGRAYRQRVYAPDRIQTPLRRTGKRGDGAFEPVSWDTALDEVAERMLDIRQRCGNEAIMYIAYSGNTGTFLHSQLGVFRLLSLFGGFTPCWGSASFWGSLFSSEATYGTLVAGHTPDDILNAQLILMWGWNPAETVQKTNTAWYLARAREQGSHIVAIDPRFTDSAAAFAREWIPIRPGTDAAMLIAMAHVMIAENLYDRAFVETYTSGFDQFKEYVLGTSDGTPKTPAWAAQITGVDVERISVLAREYATVKPAKLLTLGAPGRSAFGEQFHRAAATLAAMTGNIGIYGGEPAGFGLAPVGLKPEAGTGLIARRMPGNLPEGARQRTAIHITKLWDAILTGRAGGYGADYTMAYITNANPVNQFMNSNRAAEALSRLEFVVVHEQVLTATARYADIVLPINTHLERNDIIRPWQGGPYCIYMNQLIESLHESKSDLDICRQLAPRLGIDAYGEMSDEDWLREFWQDARGMTHGEELPDYDRFKEMGLHRMQRQAPAIAFEHLDAKKPFNTPSGKIEIYSSTIEQRNDPQLPPIPTWIEPWEGPQAAGQGNYPLQLISTHSKRRIHSNMHTVGWLRNLEPHTVWINHVDAEARGIINGDRVRVFNDRGTVLIEARVTNRIMPGVVSMGQGAWYEPDENGVDRGGCVNVLLKDTHSPAGAFCSNTCLVEIKKEP